MDIEHEARGDGGGVFYVERGGGRLAEMTYVGKGEGVVSINHTHVAERLRGQGVATRLMEAAVDWARASGTRLAASCTFARDYLEEHRGELGEVVA